MAYQPLIKNPRVAGNPRLRKRMKIRMNNKKKYGLGGLIGTGVGTIAGTFAGNPALGAQLGGMAGNFVEGQVTDQDQQQPQVQRTVAPGSFGVMANGGYMPMGGSPKNLKKGGKAYGFTGRSHEQGGIDLRNDVEIEGNETMDTIGGKEYVFSDRVTLPGKKKSFAQRHKELQEQGASREAIKSLKMMQERVTGRGNANNQWGATGQVQFGSGGDMKKMYQTGGFTDPPNERMYGPTEEDRPMGFGKYRPPVMFADTVGTPAPAMRGRGPQSFPGQSASNYNQWGNIDPNMPMGEGSAPMESRNLGRVATRGRGAPVKPTVPVRRNDIVMDEDVQLADLGQGYSSIAGIKRRQLPTGRSGMPSVSNQTVEGAPEVRTPSKATQSAAPAPEVRGPNSGSDPKISDMALQMAPDVMNALTGILGRDKTRKATRVAPTQIRRSYKGYNINPLLQRNVQGYRAILSDPSATRNQKLMSQMIKTRGDQSAYAEKENRDQQAKMRYDLGQARFDSLRNSRQAGFNEQYRQDKMQSEANLGLTGNFARGAYSSIANKILMGRREENMSEADKRMLNMYRKVYGDV